MGFWYLLMLLIGVLLFILGFTRKDVPMNVKIVILFFVIGLLFIIISIGLLMPGSSDLISQLLKLE